MYTCKKFKSIIDPYVYNNGIGRVFVLPNNIHRTQQFLNVEIAPQTGPLDLLMGRRSIVFLDLENIEISAYNLGFKVLYKELTQKFKFAAKYSLHAFFSPKMGDRRAEDLQSMGWVCHTRSIDKEVKNFKEQKRLNNSDAMLLLSAGSLITRSDADVVILGSGDGDLILDIANFIRELPKKRLITTMSLAGATSQRINSEKNDLIQANIEIGMDVLHPIDNKHKKGAKLCRLF